MRNLLPPMLLAAICIMSACETRTFDRATGTPMSSQSCQSKDVSEQLAESTWRWLNIDVGISTVEDVTAELGEPVSISPWVGTDGEILACLYSYSLANWPTVWISGERVIGIQFTKSGSDLSFENQQHPETLCEAKQKFGEPDIVSWSSRFDGGRRSVLWLAQGVQAEIDVGGDNKIVSLLYFAPPKDTEFSSSIWAGLVLNSQPTPGGSEFPDRLPADPFDWNCK